MTVRKMQDGRKKWLVRWYDENGKRHAERYGTREEANRRDRAIGTAKDRGSSTAARDSSMTVGDFYEDVFLPSRVLLKGNTQAGYGRRWKSANGKHKANHVGHKWGGVKLRNANDRERVQQWHAEMKKAGLSLAQMTNAHKLFNSIMALAEELEYIARSKVRGMSPKYKPQPKTVAPWLPDEIEKLRRAFLDLAANPPARTSNPAEYRWRRERDAMIVTMMGYQPLRIGEALGMYVTAVGERLAVAHHVPGVDEDDEDGTKTGDGRSMRLGDTVRSDLRHWILKGGVRGYLLPWRSNGEPWTAKRVENWRRLNWYPALELAGLPRVKPKHLRDSCVSMWLRAEWGLKATADAAGHSMQVCENTYAHDFGERIPPGPWSLDTAIAEARAAANGHRMGTEAPLRALPPQ